MPCRMKPAWRGESGADTANAGTITASARGTEKPIAKRRLPTAVRATISLSRVMLDRVIRAARMKDRSNLAAIMVILAGLALPLLYAAGYLGLMRRGVI